MVRLVCPACASKLNAKDELVGQVRNCPKCGQPVQIVARDPSSESEIEADDSQTEAPIYTFSEGSLAKPDLPKRLNRQSHYLICDRAIWWPPGKTTAEAGG